jgi:type IV secretory pathway VirB3-like protein
MKRGLLRRAVFAATGYLIYQLLGMITVNAWLIIGKVILTLILLFFFGMFYLTFGATRRDEL